MAHTSNQIRPLIFDNLHVTKNDLDTFMIPFVGKHCSVASFTVKLEQDSIVYQTHKVIINYVMRDVTAKCLYCVVQGPCGLGTRLQQTRGRRKCSRERTRATKIIYAKSVFWRD